MTKQPRSWWPAGGETRASKRHDKVALGDEQVVGPYDEESCERVVSKPAKAGTSGSRAPTARAKARDGAKSLEVQHPGTRRRRGSGTTTQPIAEQERSVSAPASVAPGCRPGVPGSGEAYNRRPREVVERRAEVGGGHSGSDDRRDNRTRRSEGPLARWRRQRPRRMSRSLACRWGRPPTPVAGRNATGRLPGGEPCNGERYARFGRGELETEVATVAGDGRPRETAGLSAGALQPQPRQPPTSPWTKNRIGSVRSTNVSTMLRACWVAHSPVGLGVIPARYSCRVAISMNTSRYDRGYY
jgi:hypothetical protein